MDGALARYKVLVFLAERTTETPVLEAIDRWVRQDVIAIYPVRQASFAVPRTNVEGDASLWHRWHSGDTGKGKVQFCESHPVHGPYTRYLAQVLPTLEVLSPATRGAMRMQKPEDTYWSLLTTGKLALLNDGDAPATVRLDGGKRIRIEPYAIRME